MGVNHSIKGETWEFCLILSSVAEVTEQGQPTLTYRAGDCFIMKPGYIGTWRTIETVRKVLGGGGGKGHERLRDLTRSLLPQFPDKLSD